MTSLRTVLVLLVGAVSLPAAVAAGFLGVVLWTGCFLGCSGAPDPFVGAALGLLAVALVAGALLLGWRLQRGAGVRRAAAGQLLGLVGGLVLLSAL